jgi:anti-sigma regulatory factor (Ser/Thr protein kinase)
MYAGDDEFLAGTVPFITVGVEAGESVLVAVDRAKIALLRSALAADADDVQFVDMHAIGGNPARIIPIWKQFLDGPRAPGQRVRGIGEPIWPGRSEAELVECHRHEALLNLAFAGSAPLTLLCPYDTAGLGADTIAGAHRSHPTIVAGEARRPSHAYCGLAAVAAPFCDPLPEPRGIVHRLEFRAGDLVEIRLFTAHRAQAAGLGAERAEDLVLAVNEVATNSVRYGGGRGTLRAWQEGGALICDVCDGGRLDDPLAGRRRPTGTQVGGYGLWLANQLCDLVQLRSLPDGVAVRVHMRVD